MGVIRWRAQTKPFAAMWGGKCGGWDDGKGWAKGWDMGKGAWGKDPWAGGKDPWGMGPWGKGGWDGGWGMPDPWGMGGKGYGKIMEVKGGEYKGDFKGKGGGKPAGDAGGGGGQPPSPNKVFVGALPKQPNEASIREFFSQFGEISEIRIMYHDNGIPKGFAFVTFVDDASAQAVFDNYEKNEIDGQWVDCKSAEKSTLGAEPRAGDWWCPQCGDLVFSTKTQCRMCGFDAGGKKGGKFGGCKGGGCKGDKGGKGKGKSNTHTQRLGDWNCPACGYLNFASKTECGKCGTPKPDSSDGGLAGGRSEPYQVL